MYRCLDENEVMVPGDVVIYYHGGEMRIYAYSGWQNRQVFELAGWQSTVVAVLRLE